jgi:hypothetical protein
MRNTMLSRVLVTFATSFVLAVGASVAPAAPAFADNPAPTFDDRCGTAQDTVTLPSAPFNTWYINEVVYNDNQTYPTPATDIIVRTAGNYTGTWPYHFTNVACPAQAQDTLAVASQRCDSFNDTWVVIEVFTNVADASTLDRPGVVVKTMRVVDPGRTTTSNTLRTVTDGQSVNVQPGGVGLLPGTWKSTAYSNGIELVSNTFFVGSCGSEVPPPGDPGSGGGGHSAKPKGVVHLANCQTGLIKAFTSTKGVLPKGSKTRFKYLVPGLKKPVNVKMRNGVKKRVRKVFRNVPNHKTVRLYYWNGHRWVLLSKDGNFGCGGS